MTFEARVLADSVSPAGVRLITTEETYPRIIHAERMTHRVHSKNSASTRAIPLATQLRNLLENPFIPEKFGVNQPGMQAFNHLAGLKHSEAVRIWLNGRDRAVTTTLELILGRDAMGDFFGYKPDRGYVREETLYTKLDQLLELMPKSTDVDLGETAMLNVHKQLAGRGLEAYMWHSIVSTGTEWSNYFGLRIHKDAQGEIATIARLTKEAIDASTPQAVGYGEWHLPFVDKGEFDRVEDGIVASVARAAAKSYNRQSVKDFSREQVRYGDLLKGGHMSPFEHQATPFSVHEQKVRERMASKAVAAGTMLHLEEFQIDQLVQATEFLGNLRGWRQHRKNIQHEDDFSRLRQD